MSAESEIRHEIVSRNPDIEVRFYLSEDPGSYVTPHWHNSLELVYMIEGSMIIRYDNSRIQTLPAGEFSVVNPRVIHSVTAFQNRALVLQIPDTVLKKIFMDMYIVYDIRPDAYLLKFNSLLYDLLYTLVHSYSVKIPVKDMEKRKKSIGKVKEIMVYIEKNHSVKLTVEDIAEKFGYNPDYISRLFKKHIGLTMIQYLYEIRLSGIIRDLQETELHIHEIFERHGCTNYKYAMQLFKSRFGCTPKEKQKEFRKQNNI